MPAPAPAHRTHALGRGFLLAGLIVIGWLVSLVGLLLVDLSALPPLVLIGAIACRTFLQTGLFIAGHDAMHRTLVPGCRSLNDLLGHGALWMYAALPYGRCRRNHLRHHRHPGSHRDPDYHAGTTGGPWAWYLRFMGSYLSISQMTRLLTAWLFTALALAVVSAEPVRPVLLFWSLPLLLSSLQLFLVGTYLPHRLHGRSAGDVHRVASLPLPRLMSLLACYHFGYHREHHAYPQVPWFRLPELRRDMKEGITQPSRLASPSQAALRSITDL